MKEKILLLGGLLIDRYLHLLYYPERGEDTLINKEKEYIGGCPYNVAIALKNLGVEPIIYSAIGDNSAGQFIQSELEANKLNTECVYTVPNSESGYCIIMLDQEKERTFFAKHGIEGQFDATMISDSLLSEINYIYLTGIYVLHEENNKALLAFLKQAHKLGKKIIFDVAPMIATLDRETLLQIIPLCYALKVNHNERLALEEIIQDKITDSPLLSNVYCVIETNGSKESITYINNTTLSVSSYPTQVIDSNGAGDNYLAGIIYGLMHNYSIQEAMHIGSACGSLACETLGTTVTYTLEDVETKISK